MQVQNSFRLRDTTNESPLKGQDEKRNLTVPKSPTLHTNQRMKLKDDFTMHESSASKQEIASQFKARPFNRKIFEKSAGKLPSVERKETTSFNEFSLSNSNAHLGKRTLGEYLLNKENSTTFKALPLDKKILEHAITPRKEKPQVTEASPFTFRTDERLKSGKSVEH